MYYTFVHRNCEKKRND